MVTVLTSPYTLPSSVTGYSVGPPFNPIIIAPAQLTSLDPAWMRCPSMYLGYGVFDPPRTLSHVGAMSPAATSVTSTLVTGKSLDPKISATPASMGSPNLPPSTGTSSADPTKSLSSVIPQTQETALVIDAESSRANMALPAAVTTVSILTTDSVRSVKIGVPHDLPISFSSVVSIDSFQVSSSKFPFLPFIYQYPHSMVDSLGPDTADKPNTSTRETVQGPSANRTPVSLSQEPIPSMDGTTAPKPSSGTASRLEELTHGVVGGPDSSSKEKVTKVYNPSTLASFTVNSLGTNF